MIQNRIGGGGKPALEKSPLNDIEQIRMDQNYYFLWCSWSHDFQGDTWFIVSEFLSTILMGNWVIAPFDRSGYRQLRGPNPYCPHCCWDRARRVSSTNSNTSPLTVDPPRWWHIGYYSSSLLLFFYQWLKESCECLTTFWEVAALCFWFGKKTLWEVNTYCRLEVTKSSACSLVCHQVSFALEGACALCSPQTIVCRVWACLELNWHHLSLFLCSPLSFSPTEEELNPWKTWVGQQDKEALCSGCTVFIWRSFHI